MTYDALALDWTPLIAAGHYAVDAYVNNKHPYQQVESFPPCFDTATL